MEQIENQSKRVQQTVISYHSLPLPPALPLYISRCVLLLLTYKVINIFWSLFPAHLSLSQELSVQFFQ
jgi:hypothetical protein